MVQPCWQPLWQFLKKISMYLTYQLVTLLLGNYSRAMVHKHLVHDCGGFTGVYTCQKASNILVKCVQLMVYQVWCIKHASDKTLKLRKS